MPTANKTIDDLLSLGGNLLGNMLGARHEVKAQAQARLEQLAQRLNIVTREEFDAAFSMLAKARDMQEELSTRLAAVEKKLGIVTKPAAKTPVKPPAPRLPSVKKGNRRPKRR